ncbi:hypothetical protein EJ06DRAFT_527004, partial [Trichodelitschia bisporula]
DDPCLLAPLQPPQVAATNSTYLLNQNSLYAPSVPHYAAKLPPKTMTATPASSRAYDASSVGGATWMNNWVCPPAKSSSMN